MKKTKKMFWWVLLVLLLAILCAAGSVYYRIRRATTAEVLQNKTVQQVVTKQIGDDNAPLFQLLPRLLGFSAPRTYLILFLNNTELRPAGGFTGVYGVIRVDRGQPQIMKIEGTETLDSTADVKKLSPSPRPLADYAKVPYWYFRDGAWAPDFPTAARDSLDLYKREKGVEADRIDTVVGITTDVLVELLKITGPITVHGLKFTPENVISELEYQVEFGYKNRGQKEAERKSVVAELVHAVIGKLAAHAAFNMKDSFDLVRRMVNERQIMAYSLDTDLQAQFEKDNWTAAMTTSTVDYLYWNDANVTALKTDHALSRSVSYTIAPDENGQLIAKTSMTYEHLGTFDWRTTRYRAYVRLYVPLGSRLLGVSGSVSTASSSIDQGMYNDKQWFGTFISIEPGDTKTITWNYILPSSVSKAIKHKSYTLAVQKQPGTTAHGLTLDLNFGTTVKGATPAETEKDWYDGKYSLKTDLRVDRSFAVGF